MAFDQRLRRIQPAGSEMLAHRTELRARVGLRRKYQPIGGKGRLALPKIE
jgi:hypothetical protein